MEAEMALLVLGGQEPKSATRVVAKVLTKECLSSTFLKNVGLQSYSKSNKSNVHVPAQVVVLEERLGRSQQQAKEMREELATMKKMKEAKAAQAQRDKE
jgi:hypothetical protein